MILPKKDLLNKTIGVGDYVAYQYHTGLTIGEIIRETDRMVVVQRTTAKKSKLVHMYASDLIKIDKNDALLYLIRG